MKSYIAALLMSLVLLPVLCTAEPVPTPDSGVIGPSFAVSDLVCVGRVTGTHDVSAELVPEPPGTYPIKIITKVISLAVDRCYKGDAEEIDVTVTTHDPRMLVSDFRPVPAGEDLLVLVRRAANGSFTLADPYWSKWKAALQTLPAPAASGMPQLERDLLANLTPGGDPNSVMTNLRILKALDKPSDAALTLVRSLFADPSLEVALEALSIAVKSGRAEDLRALAGFLEQRKPTLSPDILAQHDFSALMNPREAGAYLALESLGDLPYAELRDQAREGIRHLRNPRAVPWLIGHLDDSDPLLRYLAVISLAEITGRGGENGPGMGQFNKNPSKYTDAWKQWWADGGRARYGQP